jgi:hypothetical protein
MPRAGFEPAIPVFEPSKTVRVLNRAAIGTYILRTCIYLILLAETLNIISSYKHANNCVALVAVVQYIIGLCVCVCVCVYT